VSAITLPVETATHLTPLLATPLLATGRVNSVGYWRAMKEGKMLGMMARAPGRIQCFAITLKWRRTAFGIALADRDLY
jgi:hypothetical protein